MGWLWILWALLALAILSNDFHNGAFLIQTYTLTKRSYTYGWLYYLAVAWSVGLTLLSFGVLLRRCRLSQCRRLWYIPMLPAWFGAFLLLFYYWEGGSPTLWGVKLYHLQEAYAFLFVTLWEGCIQIGLVPSNTGYGQLFDISSVRATLVDGEGRVAYRSRNAVDLTPAQMEAALGGTIWVREHFSLHSAPVLGGQVYWAEDHTAIDAMNEDLREAAERIQEENDLIEEENQILERKARYETQNRLYTQIAFRTHEQLVKIDALLEESARDPGVFRNNLTLCTILGAYVKRRGNLTILAAPTGTLSPGDILFSMQESMEYLTAYGVECGVRVEQEIPAISGPQALLCYDFFEAAVELALPKLRAIMVNLATRGGLRLTLQMESPAALPPQDWEQLQLTAQGGEILLEPQEDGNALVRLSFREEGRT